MPGIEFLPDDDAEGAADAAGPVGAVASGDPTGPSGRHRVGRRVGSCAVVALVAAAVVWALTRPSGGGAPQAERSAPSIPVVMASVPALRLPPAPRRAECFGAPMCTESVQVPRPLRAALVRHLHEVDRVSVRSHLGTSIRGGTTYLAAREVDVISGRADVRIIVARHLAGQPRQLGGPAAGRVMSAVRGGAFDVTITYTRTGGRHGVIGGIDLDGLARDPRLEVL